MQKSRLMKIDEVLFETRMGKTKLYRLIAQGRFPTQILQGDGSVVWVREEVEHWIDCLIQRAKYENRRAA